MPRKTEGDIQTEKINIGIIISRFNQSVTENLLKGAVKAFENKGLGESSIEIFYVPGAFEIPTVMKKLCRQNFDKKRIDGILTIGCVIKGETAHFEHICESVSHSINKISYDYEMPTGFCVLTCYNPQQAYERSIIPPNAENNKGYESGLALLEMISLMNKI